MSHKILKKIAMISAIACSTTLTSQVMAQDYNPYPGKLSAQVVNVVSASTINIEAETWPGYSKTFKVSLPNIQVPSSNSEKICQRKLAEQALAFTQDFLAAGTTITVSDLKMANSSSLSATAKILTNQGSLTDALISHGFARSAENVTEEPWC
ncbi:MAG: hypothetical protein GQ532_08585 [Methylomarinum sp.]|nr:hypothetical protein [Methylomarinum sp.]